MNEQIAARLEVLRTELRKGQEELERVERRRAEVRDTVLRISGAIQVLEELAAAAPEARVRALAQ